MNEDILKGQWKQLRGEVRQRWNKLTDDDLDRVDGKLEALEGRLQERYGWEKEKVRTEIAGWRKERETGV
ncbi:MAG TPA: CsbD family protein [Vicinamibacterales bacterium]|nr:CsbD family protein [Vicinamibacterales bacterium]